MDNSNRMLLFDEWADQYDLSVQNADGFPFGGYARVLQTIARLVRHEPKMRILDLGTGTGNLTKFFLDRGCDVWAIDFSARMLLLAMQKAPCAHPIQADLLHIPFPKLSVPFRHVVSAYCLHEFKLPIKIALLNRIARDFLASDGSIIVGDIAFASIRDRDQAHEKWDPLWDEEEYYWAADETAEALLDTDLMMEYQQISECGGVFIIRKR